MFHRRPGARATRAVAHKLKFWTYPTQFRTSCWFSYSWIFFLFFSRSLSLSDIYDTVWISSCFSVPITNLTLYTCWISKFVLFSFETELKRLVRNLAINKWRMQVAAWYHGTPGPKVTTFGSISFDCMARPLTRPNFVALWQSVRYIHCKINLPPPLKSRPKFTLSVNRFVTNR